MTEHPSVETLLDLTLGELDDERAGTVRDHLIDCDACRAQVQSLLETSDEPPAGHEPVSQFEKNAARRDLAQALRDEGFDSAAERLVKQPDIERPEPRQPWWTLGLAAAVSLVSFGLGSWFGSSEVVTDQGEVHSSLGALTTPTGGPVRGPSTQSDPVEPVACLVWSGAAGGHFVWSVEAPGGETVPPVVDVEIVAPDGTVEPRLAGGVPDGYGRLVIVRPASITPDGIYTIRWFTAGGREPLAEQRLRVACSG